LNNILFLCLDSMRYDTFLEARTPNIDGILGKARKVYSPACWTLPSMISYLMGIPPIGIGKALFEDHELYKWAPTYFSEKGFVTIWASPNAMMFKLDMEFKGRVLKGFRYKSPLNYQQHGGVELLIGKLRSISYEHSEPLFICSLLMETHHPYFDGSRVWSFDPNNPILNFEKQKAAVEYVDRVIPKLFNILEGPTTVIITSDHGELFGPTYFGHNPIDTPALSHLTFDPKLFEIPFVRGVIGE